MKNIILAVAAFGILSACATASSDIAPSYVSPDKYNNHTCKQMRQEALNIATHAGAANTRQDQQVSDDAGMAAVGAILFWPSLLFIGGDGANAAEVARLKGKMAVIEAASIRRDCGITFQSAAIPAAAASAN